MICRVRAAPGRGRQPGHAAGGRGGASAAGRGSGGAGGAGRLQVAGERSAPPAGEECQTGADGTDGAWADAVDVEVLDDRYRLGEPIGRGGMADVYAAEDTASGRMVAVKVLRIGETADPARFEAEMEILRRLRHEAIVRLCDSGTTDADNPYFVMELIDGQTLSALVRDRGPLDPDRVAAIGARVAAALAHAH